MYGVTREIPFCYGHRLLEYAGKCRYLHGHNGTAVISLEAPELDQLGMVVDFSRLKQTLGKWIDDHLDHRMILHRDDPALGYLQAQGAVSYTPLKLPTILRVALSVFSSACYISTSHLRHLHIA